MITKIQDKVLGIFHEKVDSFRTKMESYLKDKPILDWEILENINENFSSRKDGDYADCKYCNISLPYCHCKCPYCEERDKCKCALFDAATGG